MAARTAPLIDYLHRLASPRRRPDPGSDAALLDRFARRRDEDAFAALVARHGPMVMRVCRGVLADPHLAEDAFQAAFLVLARKGASVRPPEALAAWLHGVARRAALKARTAAATRRSRETPVPDLSPPDAHAGPPAELTARELLDALDEEVGRLPQAYRLPVVLCCLEGLSQEEAARRLGWTPGSVKGRLERGRARLHARLVRRGLTLAAVLGAAELARGASRAVPPVLAGATAGAAAAVASGKSAAEAGAAAGMGATKLKVAALLLLAVGLAAASVGLLASATTPAAPPAATGGEARPDNDGAAVPLRLRPPTGPAVSMQGKEETFWGLAFSPDGKRLAGGGREGAVWLWDAADGERLRTLKAGAGIVRAVCFSHDGVLLASASDKLRLWDARSGEAVRTLDRTLTVAVPYEAVAFSPDDKLLAGTAGGPDDERLLQAQADDNRYGVLALWDVGTGKLVRTLDASGGGPVAFSPDGKRVAGAGRDKTGHDAGVAVWDASTGKAVLALRSGYASAVAFSADGKRLAAGTDEGEVRVWDAAGGAEVFRAGHAHARRVVCVAFVGDKYLVSVGQRRHERGLLSFEPWPPDYDGEVQVWSARTGEALFAFRADVGGDMGACLDPEGARVAVSPGASREPVKVWTLTGGE